MLVLVAVLVLLLVTLRITFLLLVKTKYVSAEKCTGYVLTVITVSIRMQLLLMNMQVMDMVTESIQLLKRKKLLI
ncbi:hypothetical protein D3C80_1509570 [compost metagenome]